MEELLNFQDSLIHTICGRHIWQRGCWTQYWANSAEVWNKGNWCHSKHLDEDTSVMAICFHNTAGLFHWRDLEGEKANPPDLEMWYLTHKVTSRTVSVGGSKCYCHAGFSHSGLILSYGFCKSESISSYSFSIFKHFNITLMSVWFCCCVNERCKNVLQEDWSNIL